MSKNNVIYLDSLPELTRILGKPTGAKLAKLGLHSLHDLLHYYPRKYPQRGELTPLTEGADGDYLTYVARLKSRDQRRVKSNTLTLTSLVFTDGQAEVTCAFFSKSPYTMNRTVRDLRVGDLAVITGTVSMRRGNSQQRGGWRRELIHPEVQPIDAVPEDLTEETDRPLVIYPTIKGVSNVVIVDAVKTAIGPMLPQEVPDPLPEQVRAEFGLLPLHEALMTIHFPPNVEAVAAARETLRFHEAFVLQTALGRRRIWADSFAAKPRPAQADGFVAELDAALPFELTEGQKTVAAEISSDLERDRPMQRLLQGEVGSGKTVVALRAMLQVVDAGGQAALLAPTEVLAAQHLQSIERTLGDLAPKVGLALLSGSLPTAQRRQALLDAASGKAGIVIGTHALLSENVQFAELGLVVVDEQHRFGVEQREVLRTKADETPHYLVMTATPIPRSVAMTIFGDVDTSTLKEVPAGRAEVQTHVVNAQNTEWVARAWERIAEEVASGGRAYIVCPRIGEEGDAQDPDAGVSVLGLAEQLAQEPALAGISQQVMHGRLSAEEKDAAMAEFASGASPVLISTTVIEVGVDVADASMMVIMDAHMFGISQLHQLRGRIGRGSRPGVCLVISDTQSSDSYERLQAFAATRDGFKLAEIDLASRKEGDVLGRAQSGAATSLRLLRVMEDGEVISNARAAAWAVLTEDPELEQHPALRAAVDRLADQQEYLDRA